MPKDWSRRKRSPVEPVMKGYPSKARKELVFKYYLNYGVPVFAEGLDGKKTINSRSCKEIRKVSRHKLMCTVRVMLSR